MNTTFYNYSTVRTFVEDACAHYDQTSPQLAAWLDELYIALAQAPATVSVFELMQLQKLYENGQWEHPHYAQNRWYKVRALMNKDRGVIDH
jgi:hypothetical protein